MPKICSEDGTLVPELRSLSCSCELEESVEASDMNSEPWLDCLFRCLEPDKTSWEWEGIFNVMVGWWYWFFFFLKEVEILHPSSDENICPLLSCMGAGEQKAWREGKRRKEQKDKATPQVSRSHGTDSRKQHCNLRQAGLGKKAWRKLLFWGRLSVLSVLFPALLPDEREELTLCCLFSHRLDENLWTSSRVPLLKWTKTLMWDRAGLVCTLEFPLPVCKKLP